MPGENTTLRCQPPGSSVRVAVLSLHPLYDARIYKHLTTLAEAGCSVSHYNLSPSHRGEPEPAPEGIRLIHRDEPNAFGWNAVRYGNALRWMHSEVERHGADLVHLHDLFLLPLAARFEVPVVFDFHDDYRLLIGRAGAFTRVAYRRWLPSVAGYASSCEGNLPDAHKPSVIVPNYPRRRDAPRTAPRTAPRAGNDGPGIVHLSYLGALNTGVRDCSVLLDVVERIMSERSDVTFELCGGLSGPGAEAVARRIADGERRFGERMRYHGELSRRAIRERFGCTDIALVLVRGDTPNRNSGSWNKVYDYLEAGAALIVTSGFDAEDEVLREGAGLIVQPGASATTVYGCIQRLLEDRPRLAMMQQAASRLSERYDWDSVAGRYLELYDRLLT